MGTIFRHLLFEVCACSGQAGRLLVEDVSLGSVAVVVDVRLPVEQPWVKVEYL